MAHANINFRCSQDYKDVLVMRTHELGYPTLSDYQRGLNQYDLMIRKPHPLTVEIAKQSPYQKDEVEQELIKIYRSGESMKGSYFEHVMNTAIETIANAEGVDRERVVQEMIERLKRGRK